MVAKPDNYAGQVRSFIALNFLLGRVAVSTLLHRLRYGPRRTDWSLLYELVVAIMASTIPDDESTPVKQWGMRWRSWAIRRCRRISPSRRLRESGRL